MSSSFSASAAGLNRSRSLRQPTAGRDKAQRKDEERNGIPTMAGRALYAQDKDSATSASASVPDGPRTMSPSRLPKPGASSIATRARAGTVGTGPSATGTRSRPTSGVFGLGRSSTVAARKPSQSPAAGEAESSKAPRPTSSTTVTTRLAKPKPIPSAAKASPSTSYRPSPTVTTKATSASTTKPESPVTAQHSRTKSTATSLTSATTLRPPRPPSAGSVASTSTTTTKTTATSKRPVGRASAVAARASHQRQPSATSSANARTLDGTFPTTNTTTRAPKQNTAGDPPRLRPAFNTLQQHYSPARNIAPKPLTSTYLAPPTPSKLPANVALSSDTAKLQTELLQLHLLHRDADTVTASWHASAKKRLGRRFAELAQEDLEVGKEEVVVEEARNIAALIAWGGAKGEEGLEDKIQVLESVLSGLWSLGEPGGRHARVVRKFEKWVDQMMAAVEARRKASGAGALMEDDEIAFVGEMDLAWKDEVSSLARKLDGWRRQLKQVEVGLPEEEMEEAQQRSSLVRILAGCRSQLYDMLAELDIMQQVERDAIAQEAEWIKRMNREAEADDTPRAGAIWRAF